MKKLRDTMTKEWQYAFAHANMDDDQREDILNLPVDSVVGRAADELMTQIESVLMIRKVGRIDAQLEDDIEVRFRLVACDQIAVWLFG